MSATKVSVLPAMISYQSKGVGVDMMLKSVLGVFRLLMLYRKDKASKEKYYKIVDTIIECRMLGNFGKPVMTLHQSLNKYNKCGGGLNEKLILFSGLFRTLEQFSGDLGFLQKVVMHQWSREKLSFCYRFFKSFSLTLGLIAELSHHHHLSALVRVCGQCKQGQTCTEGRCRSTLGRELLVSRALIVRTLCDIYVYYKWLPFYNPNTTLEYICGSISGLIGVWLVWKDDRYPHGFIPPCQCHVSGMAKPM